MKLQSLQKPLATLVSLSLVLSLMPTQALAEEVTTSEEGLVAAEEVLAAQADSTWTDEAGITYTYRVSSTGTGTDLVSITDIDLRTVKVAGVKCPELCGIHYEIHPFNAFAKPAWYIDGVAILKELSQLGIESEVYKEKRRILDYQRKKTTQKVNLYEKVQIPGYQEAIRKIKRYMEDEENLSKASSKIVKERHAQEEMEEQGDD